MEKSPTEFDDAIGLGDIDGAEHSLIRPDPRLPWENPIYEYEPAQNRSAADQSAQRAENDHFVNAVLGDGAAELLQPKPKSDAWAALDKRLGEIAETAMQGLMAKAARVAAGAPMRKQAIADRIIRPFKKSLIEKGFGVGVEQFGDDGWQRLSNSIEQSVRQVVMTA